FTKGEAEAKALALRADAYRQFNEAAVIQTVLSMLPEIVRAAAEPMSNIDTLTVLSTDGASEIVRNGTRTVVEGLTGLDIPALISGAIGSSPWASGASGQKPGGTGGTPRGGGGGGGTAGTSSRPKRPAGRGTSTTSQAEAEQATAGAPVTSAAGARAALDRAEEAFAQAGERIGHPDTPPPAAPTA